MKTIWKYRINLAERQTITVPAGGQILCVKVQYDAIAIWSEVETDNPTEERTIVIRGTGQPFHMPRGEHFCYLDTVLLGDFVWHVYEVWQIPRA